MSKQTTPPAPDDVNANNKKKAFKEGEMDNSVKLDSEAPEKKETGNTDSISSIKAEAK